MIFGRKNKAAKDDPELAEPAVDETDDIELDEDAIDEDVADDATAQDEAVDDTGDEQADESDATAAWDELDAQDWREDGPFDIDEVDLDGDEVERLDFGSLVLTPFEGMQMQLQIEEGSGQVNAALVMSGESAMEIALFAAPRTSGLTSEVRDEIVTATQSQGGTADLEEGPFGSEIRREIPMTSDQGEELVHISRTWLAQGPGWMLRGVVMGKAGFEHGVDGPETQPLHDFFCNVVVRRGDGAMVPGDLIPMTLPKELINDAS